MNVEMENNYILLRGVTRWYHMSPLVGNSSTYAFEEKKKNFKKSISILMMKLGKKRKKKTRLEHPIFNIFN